MKIRPLLITRGLIAFYIGVTLINGINKAIFIATFEDEYSQKFASNGYLAVIGMWDLNNYENETSNSHNLEQFEFYVFELDEKIELELLSHKPSNSDNLNGTNLNTSLDPSDFLAIIKAIKQKLTKVHVSANPSNPGFSTFVDLMRVAPSYDESLQPDNISSFPVIEYEHTTHSKNRPKITKLISFVVHPIPHETADNKFPPLYLTFQSVQIDDNKPEIKFMSECSTILRTIPRVSRNQKIISLSSIISLEKIKFSTISNMDNYNEIRLLLDSISEFKNSPDHNTGLVENPSTMVYLSYLEFEKFFGELFHKEGGKQEFYSLKNEITERIKCTPYDKEIPDFFPVNAVPSMDDDILIKFKRSPYNPKFKIGQDFKFPDNSNKDSDETISFNILENSKQEGVTKIDSDKKNGVLFFRLEILIGIGAGICTVLFIFFCVLFKIYSRKSRKETTVTIRRVNSLDDVIQL